MKSLSMSLSKLGKDSIIGSNSRISMSQSKGRSGDFKNMVLQILKMRNLARLLLNLMRTINDKPLANSELTIILCKFMFIKPYLF